MEIFLLPIFFYTKTGKFAIADYEYSFISSAEDKIRDIIGYEDIVKEINRITDDHNRRRLDLSDEEELQ